MRGIMKYKAIIFDLDGVLVHTDRYHYMAWKQLADRLQIPFNEKTNHLLRGVSRMESLEIVLRGTARVFSGQEKLRFAEEKNRSYQNYLQQLTPDEVDPSVRAVLESLRQAGLRLAIGSSSKNTPLILEKTDLRKYFDAVSDGNNITRSKPDPEVFLKAAQMLGIPPKDCLVVEDAVSGVEAAAAAGMDCASVGDAAQKQCGQYQMKQFGDLKQVVC